ncbi:thioesterase II family protein [Amycolatopsis sp. NPDC059657]|uniref:thioesterase II family protein n=1 Tax=Amycolatopsis sp. NPDC059657 TaxID=3346899 RepID=UPI00366CCD47
MSPRLLCFHHAGAGVSAFAPWKRMLAGTAEVVPVLLPGRDIRAREPRVTTREGLLDELAERAGPVLDRPYVLYGHSLGGLVAYTFAAAVRSLGLPPPALVVLGAVVPPDIPLSFDLDACPEAEDGLWRRRVLPVIRDDLRLAAALRAAPSPSLVDPMMVVAGHDDELAPPREVAGWRRYAAGEFTTKTIAGSHLFVRDRMLPELLGSVIEEKGLLRPESSPV